MTWKIVEQREKDREGWKMLRDSLMLHSREQRGWVSMCVKQIHQQILKTNSNDKFLRQILTKSSYDKFWRQILGIRWPEKKSPRKTFGNRTAKKRSVLSSKGRAGVGITWATPRSAASHVFRLERTRWKETRVTQNSWLWPVERFRSGRLGLGRS